MRSPSRIIVLTGLLATACSSTPERGATPIASTATRSQVGDQRPATPPLLAACRKQVPYPGEIHFRCPNFHASVSNGHLANTPRSPLDLAEASLRQESQLKVERLSLVIDGEKRDSLRFVVNAEGGVSHGSAVMAVVPSAFPGVVRLIGCETKEAAGCDGVLDALAQLARTDRSFPPPVVKSTAPVLAGRALDLPKGCEHVETGPKTCVRCGDASVCFSVADEDAPEGIDWLFDAEKGILRTHGALEEATRSCRIGGAEAECRTAEVTRADGRKFGTVLSSATVGGARHIVHCNLETALRSPLPPPCGAIIELK